MDLLSLIKPEDLQGFAENYTYQVNGFMGQKLFPTQKTRNIKLSYKQLVEGQDLPVMAQVHALDTEARIGSRPDFKELNLEKLLIKEKLDQGERIAYYLDSLGGSEKNIVEYVFNDAANLLSRVITRTEVANMEFLSNGFITVKENNLNYTVDFGFNKANNLVTLSGWSNTEHDILSDLEKIRKKAKKLGFTVVRAITSETVLGYLTANTAIKAFWKDSVAPITTAGVVSWINNYYGIEFVTNDDVYKTEINGEAKRFFDENTICFLGTRGVLGKGLFGVTPEELKLKETSKFDRMLCTLTMWETPDPATTWTKATGMYLPAMSNINKMIIAKIS